MTEPAEIKHAIELWDLNKILPYAKNAKKHSPEQIQKLANSIAKYGWTGPIVVWTDGTIIAGHGRRLAAISLKLKRVPVIVRSDLTQLEADAARLADNRAVSLEYDMDLMQGELLSLSEQGVDLTILGYDAKEIDFGLSDLNEQNLEFMVDDVSAAAEQQKNDNRAAALAADDTSAPAADALGFKRVTLAESRSLRDLMGRIETRTGKQGASALIDFLSTSL